MHWSYILKIGLCIWCWIKTFCSWWTASCSMHKTSWM